ncbi:MAG: efflux RND transporter permease subunit, partial [Verrucomicrobia bacterium]|nr:efflux RND transporter permease subunit [Verrucomicrobiota bacterium]
LTLIPVLCSLFLRGLIQEKESWLVRITKRIYSPLLALGLRHKLVVLLPVIGLLTGSVVVFNRLGAEFIPELDEGDGILQLVKAQSCGLQAAIGIQVRSETILMSAFPEIRHVFSRMGSAEIATDPMDPGDSDTYIMLKPSEEWRRKDGRRITKQELMELMQLELARNAPGQAILINQPIEMRFDEIMAGARAELSLKIFGDEHSELDRLAEAAREILRGIPGAADVEFDKIGGTPQMQITPDPMAMARHGLHPEEVNRAVEAALAGAHAGYLPEGNRQYPITVRLAEESRSNPDVIRRLPVSTDSGGC